MSIAIPPHLSHLRRDRRGLPVPFVNLWGTEQGNVAIRHDPLVGMDAVFWDDLLETVPDFTRQNIGRQRACMVENLCQVCGHPCPPDVRCLVVGGNSVELIEDPRGSGSVPVVTEPWLHRRCALYAVTFCPALIRRRHDEDLLVHEVSMQSDFTLMVSTGYVDGFPEHPSVAMWGKVQVHNLAIEGAAHSRPVVANG